MAKTITTFKTMEEQELHFLLYFYKLTPRERMQALALLQLRNRPTPPKPVKKITILKHYLDD